MRKKTVHREVVKLNIISILKEFVFGKDTYRNLDSKQYICPFAIFAGFLAQEAGGSKVKIAPSERIYYGSSTQFKVSISQLISRDMSIRA